MTSVEDQSGVTYLRAEWAFWGYGYPFPKSETYQQWSILERAVEDKKFSKYVPALRDVNGAAHPSFKNQGTG